MEKKRNDNEEMEIDLLELLMVMKKHLAAILLAGIVGLVIMFACTTILMTPLYSASSMMYVMPDNSNSNSSTLSDMQVGQQLTSDYSSMIESRSFMEDVIKKLNAADIKCTVLTKGILPVSLAECSKENEYGITLISLDEEYRERMEPGSASYKDRFEGIEEATRQRL